MRSARCHHCGRLLGELYDHLDFDLEVHPVVGLTQDALVRLEVKCPRCGKFNYIAFQKK